MASRSPVTTPGRVRPRRDANAERHSNRHPNCHTHTHAQTDRYPNTWLHRNRPSHANTAADADNTATDSDAYVNAAGDNRATGPDGDACPARTGRTTPGEGISEPDHL